MTTVQDRAEDGRTELEQTEGAGTRLTHDVPAAFTPRPKGTHAVNTVFFEVAETADKVEPFAVIRIDTTKKLGTGVEGVVVSTHRTQEDAERARIDAVMMVEASGELERLSALWVQETRENERLTAVLDEIIKRDQLHGCDPKTRSESQVWFDGPCAEIAREALSQVKGACDLDAAARKERAQLRAFATDAHWEIIMIALDKWTKHGGSELVTLGIIGQALLILDDLRRAALANSETRAS